MIKELTYTFLFPKDKPRIDLWVYSLMARDPLEFCIAVPRSPLPFFNCFHWIAANRFLKEHGRQEVCFRDFAYGLRTPTETDWDNIEFLAQCANIIPEKLFTDDEFEKIFE